VAKLLSIAEVGVLARKHVLRLSPDERRRLIWLMRSARGRPRNLGGAERLELALLVGKLEPRLLAGEALNRISPVPLPRRLVRGRSRRRRA
jgi:hypothetical protein